MTPTDDLRSDEKGAVFLVPCAGCDLGQHGCEDCGGRRVVKVRLTSDMVRAARIEAEQEGFDQMTDGGAYRIVYEAMREAAS
jgi:hypothetical protein